MSQKLMVSGASGQLGRAVLQNLAGKTAAQIIAGTRSPEKLAEFASAGIEVRATDFDDVASLDATFAGVDRLLLISTDALDEPGRRIRQQTNAVQAAARAGVQHIVYTSFVNTDDSPALVAPDHAGTEQAIQAQAVGHTILRNNIYADMFLHSLPRAVATGQLFAAAGEGRVGYVTREDCAAAAGAALASDFSGKRVLDITGPAAHSHGEIAAMLSRLSGKSVAYVPITVEQLTEGMISAGLPAEIARIYASFDVAIAAGRLDVVSGAVQELTGQAPTQLEDFLRAHRDALMAAPVH